MCRIVNERWKPDPACIVKRSLEISHLMELLWPLVWICGLLTLIKDIEEN